MLIGNARRKVLSLRDQYRQLIYGSVSEVYTVGRDSKTAAVWFVSLIHEGPADDYTITNLPQKNVQSQANVMERSRTWIVRLLSFGSGIPTQIHQSILTPK